MPVRQFYKTWYCVIRRTRKAIPQIEELDKRLKDVEKRQEIYSSTQLQEMDVCIKAIDKKIVEIEEKLTTESKEKIIPVTNLHEER